MKITLLISVLFLTQLGQACSEKMFGGGQNYSSMNKADAAQRIIGDLFDSCQAGKNAEAAVKAAIMTEDNAAIVWTALQIGTPLTIAQADIDKLYDRYQNVYGQ